MKHLFFVAVATGIFSGTTISVKAQTNVNIEKYGDRALSKNSPKFIEGIEIKPEASSHTIIITNETGTVNREAISNPTNVKRPVYSGNIEHCSPLQFKYAMMTDMEVESITNLSLYNFINDWWATRYKFGGDDRSGIDCSAFTEKILSTVYQIKAPRTAKDQYKICEKIAVANLVEGDLVFFNTRGGISHVGLYLGNNFFVHSSVSGGVTISSLTDDYYSKKFVSGGRIIAPVTPIP